MLFLKPGDEVIISRHAFAVYSIMAQLFGAKTIEIPDPHYTHDLEATLAAITPMTRQIFIANPNNPTGTMVSQAAIDAFMKPSSPTTSWSFSTKPIMNFSTIRQMSSIHTRRTQRHCHAHLSKIQGLANLRIGYGIAPRKLAEVLQKTRQPFNANGIAQAGALASLQDEEHMRRTREITHEGRNYLQSEFIEMGLEFVPSVANFVLVRVGDGDQVFNELLRKGIIVRAMHSYKLPEWIRVSVGTPEQNQRFIHELRQLHLKK